MKVRNLVGLVSLALSLNGCSIEQVRNPESNPEHISHYGVGWRLGMHYELVAYENDTPYVVGAVVPQFGLREIVLYHPGTTIVFKKSTAEALRDAVQCVPVSIVRRGIFYRSEEVHLGYLVGPWGGLRETSVEITAPVKDFFEMY